MTSFLRAARHRWGLFAAWLSVGVALSSALLLALEPVAWLPHGLPMVLIDLLAGPVRYWWPVLMGHPPEYDLHSMAGISTWVYAVCLPLAFAPPARPTPNTAVVTSAAFAVWYVWAMWSFVAYGAPC